MRAPNISHLHVPEADWAKLLKERHFAVIHDKDSDSQPQGVLIYLNDWRDTHQEEDLVCEGYSADFLALLQEVSDAGFEYLRIDTNGDVLDGLNLFLR